LDVCKPYAKEEYPVPEKKETFPLDGKSTLYQECATASRCDLEKYGCGAVQSVKDGFNYNVCLDLKKECPEVVGAKKTIDKVEYVKMAPQCMKSDNTAG
jgi:hypothetical protein